MATYEHFSGAEGVIGAGAFGRVDKVCRRWDQNVKNSLCSRPEITVNRIRFSHVKQYSLMERKEQSELPNASTRSFPDSNTQILCVTSTLNGNLGKQDYIWTSTRKVVWMI